MDVNEVKEYLEKELPKFTYKISDLPANKNKIWIERSGQHIVIDVRKIDSDKAAKQLRDYIKGLWKQYQKSVDKK